MAVTLAVRWLIAMVLVLVVLAAPAAAQDVRNPGAQRPRALVPLYIGFAGLQALDAHSTMLALDAGARESNPMVRGTAGNPAGMVLMKSATAAGVVLLTEKLWKRNRTAAVVSMIALNAAYATIAAHNYKVAGR